MNILFRILEMIVSFMAGQSSGLVEKSQILSAQVVNGIRQMVMALLVALGALSVFCSVFAITLNYLFKSLETHGEIVWSPILVIGSVICLLSIITFITCLRAKTWRKIISGNSDEEKVKQATTSPIEQAVGLLIQDFIHERQQNRELRKNSDN